MELGRGMCDIRGIISIKHYTHNHITSYNAIILMENKTTTSATICTVNTTQTTTTTITTTTTTLYIC